jgi:cell division protein FtsB
MGVISELRRRAGDAIAPVVGFCVVAYFAYHMVEGDRGLVAWLRLNEHLRIASEELAGLRAERQGLERRVALLRPDGLDRDLLDQQARLVLNFARPGDVVVFERSPAP